MPDSQKKSTPELSFEDHINAAKCCNKAAQEHSHAAQCCATGDTDKAVGHAQSALFYSAVAQDYGMRAMAHKTGLA